MMDKDDTVGYRRPPQHNRFQPGQSGNPKGRPKGRRNLKTEVEAVFNEPIKVRERDKVKRVTMCQAMIMGQRAKALKGDTKATAWLFEFRARVVGPDSGIEEELARQLPADDEAILADYIRRAPPSVVWPEEEPTNTDDQGGSPAAGSLSKTEPEQDQLVPPDNPLKA